MSGLFGKGGGSGNTSISGLQNTLNQYGQTQAGLAGDIASLAPSLLGISNTLQSYGSPVLAGGLGQYQAGLSGQLTPAQQALTQYTLGQNTAATNQTYGNLGLGGSTMNTQDLAADRLQSLAQQEQIGFQNEQMGLGALGVGQGLTQAGAQDILGAGGLLGQAISGYGQASGNIEQQLTDILNQKAGGASGVGTLLSSLGGTSAGGGLLGLLGGGAGGAATGAGKGAADATGKGATDSGLATAAKAAAA